MYRPRQQRRARTLLGIALLLPAAGFLNAAGPNPISLFATGLLFVAAVLVVYDALRPVAVVVRTGILVMGSLGHRAHALSWTEIVRVDFDGALVSITTMSEQLYQLQIDRRAARLLSRMVERRLVSGADSEE
jgi:hypothetical protein